MTRIEFDLCHCNRWSMSLWCLKLFSRRLLRFNYSLSNRTLNGSILFFVVSFEAAKAHRLCMNLIAFAISTLFPCLSIHFEWFHARLSPGSLSPPKAKKSFWKLHELKIDLFIQLIDFCFAKMYIHSL